MAVVAVTAEIIGYATFRTHDERHQQVFHIAVSAILSKRGTYSVMILLACDLVVVLALEIDTYPLRKLQQFIRDVVRVF